MTDQRRMAAVRDWLTVRRIWTQAVQQAASTATGAALDDFLKEHSPAKWIQSERIGSASAFPPLANWYKSRAK